MCAAISFITDNPFLLNDSGSSSAVKLIYRVEQN